MIVNIKVYFTICANNLLIVVIIMQLFFSLNV